VLLLQQPQAADSRKHLLGDAEPTLPPPGPQASTRTRHDEARKLPAGTPRAAPTRQLAQRDLELPFQRGEADLGGKIGNHHQHLTQAAGFLCPAQGASTTGHRPLPSSHRHQGAPPQADASVPRTPTRHRRPPAGGRIEDDPPRPATRHDIPEQHHHQHHIALPALRQPQAATSATTLAQPQTRSSPPPPRLPPIPSASKLRHPAW
jgi:hypothetical protein